MNKTDAESRDPDAARFTANRLVGHWLRMVHPFAAEQLSAHDQEALRNMIAAALRGESVFVRAPGEPT